MKMSKKVIVILTALLATLLATSFMGEAYHVKAQEVDENQIAAENLLSLLSESKSEVTSLFETQCIDLFEINHLWDEGLFCLYNNFRKGVVNFQ